MGLRFNSKQLNIQPIEHMSVQAFWIAYDAFPVCVYGIQSSMNAPVLEAKEEHHFARNIGRIAHKYTLTQLKQGL